MTNVSRRRFLVGGSAIALAATGGVAALRARRENGTSPASIATPAPDPRTPTSTPAKPRGGLARLHSPASFNFDTFDALLTGEPSVIEVLGRTHSRLVDWADPAEASLGPSLARAWEQPEPGRLVLHIESGARWQPAGTLDAAAVSAADVRLFLERAIELARSGGVPALQRPHDWLRISKVSDASGAIVIETDPPDPFLLHTLASRFALVQRPAAVDVFESTWHERRPESAAGSGPFIFMGIDGGKLSFGRFDAGHRVPNVEGIELTEPFDVAARLRAGQLDEAILRDRRAAPPLLAELPGEIVQLSRFEDSPVISTVFAGAPPWNNPELRLAVSGALNRPELMRRLFGGRAAPAGAVSPAQPAFALSEAELSVHAGYRVDSEVDFSEARRRWDAAGGPGLGPLTLDFPAIFDPLYSASSIVAGMLREVLGIDIIPRVDSYTAIASRVAAREYGAGRMALWFGWGPPLVEPDPARYLLETYGRDSPGSAATGFRSEPLDAALARLGSEFDLDQRKDEVKTIQLLLLAEGGGGLFPWLLQRAEVLRRRFYDASAPSPFWQQHQSAFASIDTSSAAYAASGR